MFETLHALVEVFMFAEKYTVSHNSSDSQFEYTIR